MGAALVLVLIGFGALAAGILVGRYYVPDDRILKRTAKHSKAYMRAINHLLARNRDDAIDVLREVVSENVDEIEPYFALGALFRGRGEHERAIRVHQAIAIREGGSKTMRLRAKYELGLDFRRAGMPRRATRAMEEVLEDEPKHEGALRATQRAIELGDYDSAKRLLRDAQKMDEHSAHLLAAAAELASAKGNPKGATARLKQALEVSPDLAHFLVPGLVESCRQIVDAEGKPPEGTSPTDEELEELRATESARHAVVSLVEVLDSSGPSPHLQLAIAELRSGYDPVRALDDYRQVADQFPDLLPARVSAARLALASGDADEMRAELIALCSADGALGWASDGVWRCGNCGYRNAVFFWRCRECRRWGEIILDVGRQAQHVVRVPAPRERRELPRGGPTTALLGSASDALPEATLDSGLSEDELRTAGERRSFLGRVGGWFSGLRGKKEPKQLKD